MAVLLLVWCAAAAPGPAAARLPRRRSRAVERVSTDDLRRYVGTLASDELNGRGVGDARQPRRGRVHLRHAPANSVTPAGGDGSCYQPVDVYRPVARIRRAPDHLERRRARPLADLATGTDFYPLPETGDVSVTAPLVFADHGISAPS